MRAGIRRKAGRRNKTLFSPEGRGNAGKRNGATKEQKSAEPANVVPAKRGFSIHGMPDAQRLPHGICKSAAFPIHGIRRCKLCRRHRCGRRHPQKTQATEKHPTTAIYECVIPGSLVIATGVGKQMRQRACPARFQRLCEPVFYNFYLLSKIF